MTKFVEVHVDRNGKSVSVFINPLTIITVSKFDEGRTLVEFSGSKLIVTDTLPNVLTAIDAY